MTDEIPGRRDRKRQETRARLERAAVTLVLRDGLEQTTVDAISELADVSPRTFFNYFDSKDSAILGRRDAASIAAALEAHAAQSEAQTSDHAATADPVEAIVHLIVTVLGAPTAGGTIAADRMEIVRRYPQLIADQLAQMMLVAGQLIEAVTRLLSSRPGFAEAADSSKALRAEMALGVCGAAVRVAVKEWAASDEAADEDQLQTRAVALVRDVIEELA
jgi:AcrR family transcriptional regulator